MPGSTSCCSRPDRASQRRLEAGLRQAALRGLLPAARIRAARARILRLRRWLAGFERPSSSLVRGEEHEALARRAAAAAITLVRDDAGLLPLRPSDGQRIAVVTPAPRDLTPADSSVDEPLDLAGALRRHHAGGGGRARGTRSLTTVTSGAPAGPPPEPTSPSW